MAIIYTYSPRMERIRRKERRQRLLKQLSDIIWVVGAIGFIFATLLYVSSWNGTV